MIRYSTEKFLISRKGKYMSADASDLGIKPGQQVADRIYPDACDLGFTLVSHKTGLETVWVQCDVTGEDAEDLEAWHYMPTTHTMAAYPAMRGYRVTIFND